MKSTQIFAIGVSVDVHTNIMEVVTPCTDISMVHIVVYLSVKKLYNKPFHIIVMSSRVEDITRRICYMR
mgnify:CR=1 FL=1